MTRRDAIAAYLPASPFAGLLRLEVLALPPDRAVLRLRFRAELATTGDVVHGGAIAALIDTAGTSAAWSDDAEPASHGGSTISRSITHVLDCPRRPS